MENNMTVKMVYEDYNDIIKCAILSFKDEDKEKTLELFNVEEEQETDCDTDKPEIPGSGEESQIGFADLGCEVKELKNLVIVAKDSDIEEVSFTLKPKNVKDLIKILKQLERQL